MSENPDKCPNCEGELCLGMVIYGCAECGCECCSECSENWGVQMVICQDCNDSLPGTLADLRRQLTKANEKLMRLADGGLDGPNLIDDSMAFWGRIDEFRQDQSKPLSIREQRELAEWWAERGSLVFDLDEKCCRAQDQLAERDKEITRLQAIVNELCAQVPPPDWEPSYGPGEPAGYGKYGDPNFVDDVDVSKPEDVHAHGVAVGMWRAANMFRKAAEAGEEKG